MEQVNTPLHSYRVKSQHLNDFLDLVDESAIEQCSLIVRRLMDEFGGEGMPDLNDFYRWIERNEIQVKSIEHLRSLAFQLLVEFVYSRVNINVALDVWIKQSKSYVIIYVPRLENEEGAAYLYDFSHLLDKPFVSSYYYSDEVDDFPVDRNEWIKRREVWRNIISTFHKGRLSHASINLSIEDGVNTDKVMERVMKSYE